MKLLKGTLIMICVLVLAFSVFMPANVFAASVSTTGCFQSYETNLANRQLTIRMKALSGSFTINNSGGSAGTYTITVKNVDPDYVTISQGTITSRGDNSFVFSLNVPANGSTTVNINPWYLPDPNNFYFIAWSDNQDGTSYFKNKLLPKAALINPILSVCAGDVLTGTPPTIGGAGTPNEYGYPNDGVKDQDFLNYLSLINNYTTPIFEVPGNHDLARGGWVDRNDSRYDAGQALWRKYLGPINYSFDVGNAHFTMTNFHYDIPNWTKRWGGNINGGYLRLGTYGYGTTLPNDDNGDALYNWLNSDLTAAAGKTNRIVVSHHNFNMFIGDGGTVSTARNLFSSKNVNYMISGHQHNYQTGTDSVTGIPYLVTGDAQKSNPGFSLVHVNGSNITQQHMYADNLNLNVTYNTPNDGSASQGKATVSCSGYNLPFVRLKFKLSNGYASYTAKDTATGASIPAYSKQFSDYTVVYVETSINNGATKNIQVDPVGQTSVNLSQGKPASSNGSDSGYGPEKGNNGIATQSDGWSSSASTNPWWQVDLGSAKTITKLELIDRPGIEQITARRNFEIRASNDPSFSTYTVLASQGSSTFPDDTTWTANISDTNAYRYIRFYKTVNEYMFICEFKVWGSDPVIESNLSQCKPATSNGASSGYGPEKGNNGIATSVDGWSSSASTNPWWQVDLGSAKTITKLELIDRPSYDQTTSRRNFQIRASNDPSFSTYTVLASQGSTPFPDDTTWTANISDTNTYRYIRFYKTANEYMFICEFKVWGY